MNASYMEPIYEFCKHYNKPIIMHVGREPKSTAYKCDPYLLCSTEKVERVLRNFPGLRICVPHMGFDEVGGYRSMIETYDDLWLDTAMLITDYFPTSKEISLGSYRSDRIMYGSDFPNIPYAWDREIRALEKISLSDDAIQKITHKNSLDFFGITAQLS